ncbi:MAG: hypothetical protein HY898_09940 [Deltaproteobacteria bacterium]|nr:hypothetical protein [Deltaproteobacteria bacterium]
MGIDRIGRAGGGVGITPPTTVATEPSAAVSESFRSVAKDAVRETGATQLLDQLKSGQIDMNRYLDLRVEQATSHLQGAVDPERLDFIRHSLRIQIESDPALLELVQAATGSAPTSQDDG